MESNGKIKEYVLLYTRSEKQSFNHYFLYLTQIFIIKLKSNELVPTKLFFLLKPS